MIIWQEKGPYIPKTMEPIKGRMIIGDDQPKVANKRMMLSAFRVLTHSNSRTPRQSLWKQRQSSPSAYIYIYIFEKVIFMVIRIFRTTK